MEPKRQLLSFAMSCFALINHGSISSEALGGSHVQTQLLRGERGGVGGRKRGLWLPCQTLNFLSSLCIFYGAKHQHCIPSTPSPCRELVRDRKARGGGALSCLGKMHSDSRMNRRTRVAGQVPVSGCLPVWVPGFQQLPSPGGQSLNTAFLLEVSVFLIGP